MQDKNIHNNEAFTDRSWSEMQKILDREMPVESKRRRPIFFWLFGFLMLSTGITAMYFTLTQTEETHQVISEIIGENEVELPLKTDLNSKQELNQSNNQLESDNTEISESSINTKTTEDNRNNLKSNVSKSNLKQESSSKQEQKASLLINTQKEESENKKDNLFAITDNEEETAKELEVQTDPKTAEFQTKTEILELAEQNLDLNSGFNNRNVNTVSAISLLNNINDLNLRSSKFLLSSQLNPNPSPSDLISKKKKFPLSFLVFGEYLVENQYNLKGAGIGLGIQYNFSKKIGMRLSASYYKLTNTTDIQTTGFGLDEIIGADPAADFNGFSEAAINELVESAEYFSFSPSVVYSPSSMFDFYAGPSFNTLKKGTNFIIGAPALSVLENSNYVREQNLFREMQIGINAGVDFYPIRNIGIGMGYNYSFKSILDSSNSDIVMPNQISGREAMPKFNSNWRLRFNLRF